MNESNETMCLEQWLRVWLADYVKPTAKPAGYEHYLDNCEKHIIPKLGALTLRELTPAVLQRFFNEESAGGNLRDGGALSAKSVKNMRVVLDVALSAAVSEGLIGANPVRLTVIRKVPHKRVDTFSDEEQAKIEKYLLGCGDSYAAASLVAMHTGMRLGEICALRWNCFDPREKSVEIRETVKRLKCADPDAPTKTQLVFSAPKTEASERVLYLPDFLAELVEVQRVRFTERFGTAPQGMDFVFFSAKGTAMDPDNASHYFLRVLDALGLKRRKFHAMRHTFATREIERGVDVSTVSGLLGHADVTTTTHFYIHPRDRAMQNAMRDVRPLSR